MIPLKCYCCQCSKVWRISQSLMILMINTLYSFYIWRPRTFTGVILVYQKNFVGIELFSPAKNFSFCWNFAWEVARAFWVIHTRNMALMSCVYFLAITVFFFCTKPIKTIFSEKLLLLVLLVLSSSSSSQLLLSLKNGI